METEKNADYLFWIGGIAVAIAAIRTVLAGVITDGAALILLGGSFVLVWGLLRIGRRDIAYAVFAVIAAVAMAVEWAARR
jgi:hypothetical protein